MSNENVSSLKSLENGYFLLAIGLVALTLLGGLVNSQLNKSPWLLVSAVCLTIFGLAATVTSSTSYYHYLQLLLPGAGVGIALVMQVFTGKMREVAAAVTIAVAMLPIIEFAKLTATQTKGSVEEKYTNQVHDILRSVPESEHEQIFAWELHAQYFLVSETLPLHRFFTFQNWWGQNDPAVMIELGEFFEETPPKWLLSPLGKVNDQKIASIFENEYVEVARNEKFLLRKHIVE